MGAGYGCPTAGRVLRIETNEGRQGDFHTLWLLFLLFLVYFPSFPAILSVYGLICEIQDRLVTRAESAARAVTYNDSGIFPELGYVLDG